MLDTHFDAQHNRCVFTLVAEREALAEALVAGAEHAIDLIDMRSYQGLHPHTGALDVCPAVWVTEEQEEVARGVALEVAQRIGALGIPVFLYGELASSEERRERAYFRTGGPAEMARRMAAGELAPDFGPEAPHPSAGATLVTARRPAGRLQPRARHPQPRDRPGDRRRSCARLVAGSLGCGRSGCHATASARRSR